MTSNASKKSSDDTPPHLVVGVGASAGGLAPMRELFSALPDHPKMSFIVVQHSSKDRPHLLADILEGHSSIAVVSAEDGLELQNEYVYVAEPHSIVTVDEGHFSVRPSESSAEARRTIDPMLASLAEVFGPRAVGVILSGNDADGTAGLRAIASAGGLTIAQSPETADFDVMPRSAVESGAVDLQLEPAQIPAKLSAYYDDLVRMRQEDRESAHGAIVERLEDIARHVRRETGHDFAHYKTNTLVRRIQRRMRVLHISDADAYVQRLGEDADEARALFREILISVTSFFRDPEYFEVLADKVVPRLVEGSLDQDNIRVWVPGCATGEEAYSLAILICEALDDVDVADRPRVQIFATDIDVDALQIARRGIYPMSIAADVSQERLEAHFRRVKDHFEVDDELRDMCLFAEHNILRDPPFVDLGLITCRNLLIYLDRDLQEQLLLLFHHSLKATGFLFLGSSETTSVQPDLFCDVSHPHRIWQNTADMDAPRPRIPMDGGLTSRSEAGTQTEERDRWGLPEQFQRILANQFAPCAAVVRADGKLVYASSRLERYLQIPRGRFQSNLIKMVSAGLRMGVRAALQKAVDTGERVVHDNLTYHSSEGTQPARIIVEPMPASDGASGLYMVVFEETGPPVEHAHESLRDPDKEAERIIDQLEHELESTRENLERTVQDLETSNEELKSSNEELRSMNEELQSANEELEVSKKNVEAANEKLAQAKSDLENLLDTAQFATLFLGEDHLIKMFTPAMCDIYKLRPTDVGRPLDEISDRAVDMPSLPPIDELGDEPVVDEIRTDEDTWYIRRVFPYETRESQQRAMIVTFTDVTDLKETAQKLRRRSASLEEAKRRAEAASQAKNQFLANMSHELRTPLTAILGFAEILLSRLDDPDDRKAAETIEQSGEFLLDILNDVLDLSRIEKGNLIVEPSPLDIREFVDKLGSLMELRARQKGLALSIDIDASVPPVLEADPTRLRQILVNLVGNAIKFTEAGRVEVRVSFIDEDLPRLCFDIIDTGIGISEQAQKEVFEPFAQSDTSESRRYQGTGLGLTISQRLVDQLGGSLEVDSELGEGTKFTVCVPTRALPESDLEESSAEALDELSAPKQAVDARVLVVDDLEDIRHLARHFLERAGCSVESARTGQAALERVEAADNTGRAFDVIVMDMQMPGLDGYETTRRLRAGGFDRPIIALTASAMRGDSKKCFEAGCTDYLPKPIDSDALIERVAVHAHHARAEGAHLPGSDTMRPNDDQAPDTASYDALIVEDNADVAEAMKMLMESRDIEVRCVHDGQSAIEAARADQPPIIVLDLGLPDMSGYEALAKLQGLDELDEDTRFFALSGRNAPEEIEKSKEAGFEEHLVKPGGITRLVELIQKG